MKSIQFVKSPGFIQSCVVSMIRYCSNYSEITDGKKIADDERLSTNRLSYEIGLECEYISLCDILIFDFTCVHHEGDPVCMVRVIFQKVQTKVHFVLQ